MAQPIAHNFRRMSMADLKPRQLGFFDYKEGWYEWDGKGKPEEEAFAGHTTGCIRLMVTDNNVEPSPVVVKCAIDVIWKAKTLIGVLAIKMHVHPDALSVWVGGLQVNENDFLTQYETSEFCAKFKAAMPNYFSFDRLGNSDDNLRPAFANGLRIFARHPAKRVLRTIAVEPGLTILDAIKRLLPDLTVVCPFQMYMLNAPLEHQTLIVETLAQSQIKEIMIEWSTMRPLQVTKVVLSLSKSEPGSLGFQKVHNSASACERWIRSPFKCKADAVRIPADVSLAAVGNAYLAATQMPGSIAVHAGSRLLDPVMTLGEVDVHEVISFRMAALPGGAKSEKQEVKQKIRKCLLSRGVPEAVVDDRVSQFLTKVPIEVITPMPSDGDELWDKLKIAANEAKFRLVQHFELKEHRKNGRSKPPSKPQKGKGNGKGSREGKQIRAEDVALDPRHFHDSENPGVPIEVLPASRFGPDMAGLVVLNPQQAGKYDNVESMSTEALAMLVVGGRNVTGMITVPAHDRHGNPIVLQAQLIQCGDRDTEYRPAIPNLDVETIAATTVEFTICKDHVTKWNDVASPLNYIGTHVPALRGNALISSWSIKCFSAMRVPCGFKEADHFHGFFKVNDSILEAALGRSGKQGIFFSPKTDARKFDPRFPIVALPGVSFQNVVSKAQACEGALGIALVADHFGVRCKRADLARIRSLLLPEGTFVAAADIDEDMELYILKRVPAQVSKDELTRALCATRWNAVAIRLQGNQTGCLGHPLLPSVPIFASTIPLPLLNHCERILILQRCQLLQVSTVCKPKSSPVVLQLPQQRQESRKSVVR